MRTNLENNLARQLRLLSPTHETLVAEISGAFIVPDDGPMFYFLDGGVVNRLVYLPEIPPQGGMMYFMANTGASAELEVVDANGAAVATIEPDQSGIFFCSFTEWSVVLGFLTGYAGILDAFLSEPRVVTADFVVGAGDATIAIQKVAPAATAGTLPSVVGRNGKPISIIDWSSGIVDHTITLTPDGAETIMQQPTWTLVSNAANLASITLWPSETLNGWYTKP